MPLDLYPITKLDKRIAVRSAKNLQSLIFVYLRVILEYED
jgi:hypothetical protein